MQTLALPTSADIEFFKDQGYWIGPVAIDEERLERAREAMDRVYAGEWRTGVRPRNAWLNGDPNSVRQTLNSWWSDLDLRAIATDAYIAQCAAILMEVDQIKLWEDQLLYKPGGGAAGGSIGLHQDWHYWGGSASIPELCTAWVAFDDVDERNGAMRFAPRSHHWELLDESNFHGKDLETQAESIARKHADYEEMPVVLKAGQFSIHDCGLLHGSGPNTTDKPRRSMAIHMMSGNVQAVTRDDHPVARHQNWGLLQHLGKDVGEWDGVFWPTLYPAGPIDGPTESV